MSAIERVDAIAGNGIIQSQINGHTEVFSDLSGVTISAISGNIDFIDQNLSGYINLSEPSHAGLQTVNNAHSIIGLLNQVAKFYVSSTDTVAAYFTDKVSAGDAITINVNNPGGNEVASISVNQGALSHNNLGGLQGGNSSERYHLTSQQLIDLTSGLSADNQHYHNASAIAVDNSSFDIISGTNVQAVFNMVDELFKTRNTMLVNFDLAGSIRNGNTSLAITNGVGNITFLGNKEGIAAFNARVPENYIEGTDLKLRIKWFSFASGTNNVYWRLTYKDLAVNDLINIAGTNVDQIVAEPGVALRVVQTEFTIPGGAFQLGNLMSLVVSRLGDNALDTSNANSGIIEISLDY